MAPRWAFPRSYIDCDFGNRRTWGGSVNMTQSGTIGVPGSLVTSDTNIAAVLAPDRTGKLITQPNQGLRITDGMGLWASGAYTQQALWNRDLTNAAWVATNVTVAKTQVGADGVVNGASSITATAALGTVLQTVTATSTAKNFSAYIKRLSGTGTLALTLDNVTFTPVTVPASGYAYVSIPTQTLANPIVGFQIGTLGDSFAIDYCSCANRASPSPLVAANTSATGSFFGEEPALGSSSGIKPQDGFRILRNAFSGGAPWSMYMEASGVGISSPIWLADDSVETLRGAIDGTPISYTQTGATLTTSNSGNIGVGNWNRVVFRVRGDGASICLNGGPIAHSFSGFLIPSRDAAITHCGIGNNGSYTTSIEGCTRRMAIWQYGLMDHELVAYSTLPS